MQFELTAAMVEEIKQQAVKLLVNELRSQININSLRTTIVGEVRSELVSKIAGDAHAQLNKSDFVNSAIKSAEQRINARIEDALKKGVSLQISIK